MFETPKDPCVAVVVDPSHPHFGEIATVEGNESDEFGETLVVFENGAKAVLRNGMTFDEPDLPQVRMFLTTDMESTSAFRERLPGMRSALVRISAPVSGRTYEHLFHVKQEFLDALHGATP